MSAARSQPSAEEVRALIEDAAEFDLNSGCWLWSRGVTGDGYGALKCHGYPRSAHRASWQAHNGPIPPGLHILHSCDTPQCVNPAHLRAGTHAENMADITARGRRKPSATGTYAPMSHCRRGHEFTSENTFIDARGDRGCLECRRARNRAFKRRRQIFK